MKPLTGLPVDCFVQVSQECDIPLKDLLELVRQVENGTSVAFLARYRADLCGGLDEESVHGALRRIRERQDLIDHRISMLTTLGQRGVLTPALRKQLEEASDRRELNDVFAPYRARKRDEADAAIENGMDPLARALWAQQDGVDLLEEAATHLAPERGIDAAETALEGAYAIASRWLGEKPEILRELRKLCRRDCELVVSTLPVARNDPRSQALDGFRAKVAEVDWHKRLSIRRGIRTGVLEARTEFPVETAARYLERCLIVDEESKYAPHLKKVVAKTLENGLLERIKGDVLRQIDDQADAEAVGSYCKALREALLGPVAHGLNIIGVETGRPGGWRAALIDGDGALVDYAIVRQDDSRGGSGRQGRAARRADLPVAVPLRTGPPVGAPPPLPSAADQEAAPEPEQPASQPAAKAEGNETAPEGAAPESEPAPKEGIQGDPKPPKRAPRAQQARVAELSEILTAHDVDLIVFPAGPRHRDTERFLRAQIRDSGKTETAWLAMRDKGTWIFATSKTAKREFPRLDPAFRSAISLARRVQDPMAELVKADPRTVGIGNNHHEVDGERLRRALGLSMERAVHDAGVDVNRAHSDLLALVPGITPRLARRVVEHRREHGPFRSRASLLEVDGLGEQAFAQAVGFLRVYGGDPLDATGAHPEYHALHEQLAETAGCDLATLLAEPERLDAINAEELATQERSVVFVQATMEELKPSRRRVRGKFQLPTPVVPLRPDEELRPGAKVSGVVASVADFGVFIDIGGDQDGLLHVSQIDRDRVKDSKPDFNVGDSVEVYIKASDRNSRRILLSTWGPRERPPRDRDRGGPPSRFGDRPGDGRRRRGGPDRGDRRRPYSRTFGPDTEESRSRGSQSRMSLEEKLDRLKDQYRTKV